MQKELAFYKSSSRDLRKKLKEVERDPTITGTNSVQSSHASRESSSSSRMKSSQVQNTFVTSEHDDDLRVNAASPVDLDLVSINIANYLSF